MLNHKRERKLNEGLDELGRNILRASASNEAAAEQSAASPFLYARLRSRIMEERQRREEGDGWLTMLWVAWRTVPAMAVVALFALVLFLFAGSGARSSGGFIDEALLGGHDAGVEQVVFADHQPLSRDDVLSTILDEDEQGASR
jgi:hypothetical protein